MKHLLFALLTLFSLNALVAQGSKAPATPPAAPAEKNDPEAKKILDKIRKKYESYKSLEATFSLKIELPGKKEETQKGTIAQEGDKKFRLDMDDQIIVSDGTTTWVYLKKNNEVQINDADPKDSENGFLTPKSLLKRYQKGDYTYAVTEKTTENSKLLTHIEFKPNDKKSEYSKLRVSVDEKASSIQSVKAFGKDGSRYTFSISKLTPNKKFAADHFTFDTKKYPGVKVEDLRL
jgi:outer membrane lipoprotein-sorting protein